MTTRFIKNTITDLYSKFGMQQGGRVFIMVTRQFNSSRATNLDVDEMVWTDVEMMGSK